MSTEQTNPRAAAIAAEIRERYHLTEGRAGFLSDPGGWLAHFDLTDSDDDALAAINLIRAESRTYVVGLPVAVTVHDDGTVTYDVDTSEAGSAVRENYPSEHADPVTPEQVDADAERIEADHTARAAGESTTRQTLADVFGDAIAYRVDSSADLDDARIADTYRTLAERLGIEPAPW